MPKKSKTPREPLTVGLFRAALNGDVEAFTRIAKFMHCVARNAGLDEDGAKEVVQVCWASLWKGFDKGNKCFECEDLAGPLAVTVKHECTRERKRSGVLRFSENIDLIYVTPDSPTQVPVKIPDPLRQAPVNHDLKDLVAEVITGAELDMAERQHVDQVASGISSKDIAKSLGWSYEKERWKWSKIGAKLKIALNGILARDQGISNNSINA